jgi:adenine phosphoribosyltransferase
MENSLNKIISLVRDVRDYPKEGIIFKDITPVLQDHEAFSTVIDRMADKLASIDFDYIAGIEARGFIIGSALAYKTGKGFIPIRKKGKLPYATISREYALEYGNATIEMHADAVRKGSKIVIVDDLLATGGTAKAASELVTEAGGFVKCMMFMIELEFLKGREILDSNDVISLIKY